MTQSNIALAIIILTIIVYMIPQIPIAVTTLISLSVMAFMGIISFQTAFSGFSSTATLLVIGMMVMGKACYLSGLMGKISGIIFRFSESSERVFIVLLMIVSALLSVFLNGALVVGVLMAVVDSVAIESKGAIKRKNVYFPLGIASTYGNNLTSIGATSTVTALSILYASGYRTIGVFEPMLLNLPGLLVIIALYSKVGYDRGLKLFKFKEENVPVMVNKEELPVSSRRKQITVGIIMILMLTGMIAGVDYGGCAVLGIAMLIVFRCIDEKTAYASVNWSSIVLIGGTIGLSAGVQSSGAGEKIANTIIAFCGNNFSEYNMCIVMLVLGALISNFMSDNGAAAILTPIALVIANAKGWDPLPIVLATASGVKSAIGTPLSVATMTMLQEVGYRFIDYLRVPGVCNIIYISVTAIALKLVYFL